MAERVGEAPLPFEHPAEAQVGVGRSGVVAQRGVQLEGLLEMGVGVAVAVQPSCQAYASNPASAACRIAASRTGCSAVNQAIASSWSAGASGVTPGRAGTSVIGSRCG